MRRFPALVAAAIALAPAALLAQAPTQDQDVIAVKARVLQPIDVAKVQDLDFGDVFRGQAAKVIDSKITAQTGTAGRPGDRGYFTVESSRDQNVQLTFTLVNPSLVGGTAGDVLTVDAAKYCIAEAAGACAADAALDGTPFLAPAFSAGDNTLAVKRHVYVGGSLTAPAAAKLGAYAGTLTLKAEYNGL